MLHWDKRCLERRPLFSSGQRLWNVPSGNIGKEVTVISTWTPAYRTKPLFGRNWSGPWLLHGWAFFDEEVDHLIGIDGTEEISVYLGAVGHIDKTADLVQDHLLISHGEIQDRFRITEPLCRNQLLKWLRKRTLDIIYIFRDFRFQLRRWTMEFKRVSLAIILMFSLLGCAGVLHDNLKIPAGEIAGNQFTGIRYPFRVSAPSYWKMTTEFPDF